MASVAAAAAAAVYAVAEAESLTFAVLALGTASAVLLVAGLSRATAGLVPAAFAGLGAAWALSAWTQGAATPGGTIAAVGAIFLAAELAYWSLEQVTVADEGELVARRAAEVAVRAAAALALAAVLLAALGLHAGGGLLLEAVGVAAAVGLLVLVVALARAESGER